MAMKGGYGSGNEGVAVGGWMAVALRHRHVNGKLVCHWEGGRNVYDDENMSVVGNV